jgi:hypothetical protein
MAEREGFEPPIDLRLCLISSQVHSTGLCHLSAFFYFISGDLITASFSLRIYPEASRETRHGCGVRNFADWTLDARA